MSVPCIIVALQLVQFLKVVYMFFCPGFRGWIMLARQNKKIVPRWIKAPFLCVKQKKKNSIIWIAVLHGWAIVRYDKNSSTVDKLTLKLNDDG